MARKSNLIDRSKEVVIASQQVKLLTAINAPTAGDKLISKRLPKKTFSCVFLLRRSLSRRFFHESGSKRDMKSVHISCFDDT
jgi:hypothetical protein